MKSLCQHITTARPSYEPNTFFTCSQCGSTQYKFSESKTFSAIKPIGYQGKCEINSIASFSNIQSYYSNMKIDPPSQWYLKNRSKAIKLLQKYSAIYDYSELTYFLALYYIDSIMRKMTKLSKKKFEVYIIDCFIIAAKFKETSILEPNLSRFTSTNDYYDIDEMDIIIGEVEVLILLQYKLDYVSSFEILNMFFYDGFVYSSEINNKSKEFTNIVYCYAKKIFNDIIHSDYILPFSPLQIAFSVVHLTRKNFGFKTNFFNLIKKYYNIHLSDYKDCLSLSKKIINNEPIEESTPKKEDEEVSIHISQYKQTSQSSRTLSNILKSTQNKGVYPKPHQIDKSKLFVSNPIIENVPDTVTQIEIGKMKTPDKSNVKTVSENVQRKRSDSDIIIKKAQSEYIKQLRKEFIYEDMNSKSVKTKLSNKDCIDKIKQYNYCIFVDSNNQSMNFPKFARKRSRSLMIMEHFIFL